MKKITALLMALCLIFVLCACGAETAEESTVEETAADATLAALAGTYVELFPVINDPAYDQLWVDYASKFISEDMMTDTLAMLKGACTATIYGQEAVDAYAGDPESAMFDCYFINGVKQFTFEGNTISGTDEAGNTVFSHEYAYVEDFSIEGMMEGRLYKTEDADAGEFTYFLILPDTPDTTYHIEFRYGSDLEALGKYAEGAYAYWLAAGIPADADAEMIENCIELFVNENLGGIDDTAEEAA